MTIADRVPPVCEPPLPASIPTRMAPAGATDSHLHLFGPRETYPLSPRRGYTPSPEAHLTGYLDMANTLGLERMVIVQPAAYGTDHTCALDTVERLGLSRARAVAIIDDTVSQEYLRQLNEKGFRGARINSVTPNAIGVDQLRTVARRVASLGWHVQLYVSGAELPELARVLLSLPVPVVIDHMGRISPDQDVTSPEFSTLLKLLDSGKCWVKLCGYRNSIAGPPYDDLSSIARKLIAAAPENCVWGTDWPHTNLPRMYLPNDGVLLDLLYQWVPDQSQLHRILVDNPARLYGFEVGGHPIEAGTFRGNVARRRDT